MMEMKLISRLKHGMELLPDRNAVVLVAEPDGSMSFYAPELVGDLSSEAQFFLATVGMRATDPVFVMDQLDYFVERCLAMSAEEHLLDQKPSTGTNDT
jgi:hypothetical protein